MKVIPDMPHGLNYLALSVSDEGHSRHASWALFIHNFNN